jgi:hypothetical protein
MNGFWIPSLRAVTTFAIVIIALLAFAPTTITSFDGVASGSEIDWVVDANANRDTSGVAVSIPSQQTTEMRQNTASDDNESGTWLLMIFGFGAVAFALRGRRSDHARYQFA